MNGVELCTESFGDPADPPILLVMGLGGSMLCWEEGFCRLLAGHGRFVIRYDQRDTGRATTYTPGRPGYAGGDLLTDTVALLDDYGLVAAHLVGVSAGGALVQLLAFDFPDRVLSLVLISTSPAIPGDRSLPPPTPAFNAFARSATVDWLDAGSVIDYRVAYARVLAGDQRRFDEAEVRDLVRRDVERANDFAAVQNHDLLEEDDRAPHATVNDRGADARHPWHRRSHVPTGARPGARARDPKRAPASARTGRPRRPAHRLGRHHAGDRNPHRLGPVSLNVSRVQPGVRTHVEASEPMTGLAEHALPEGEDLVGHDPEHESGSGFVMKAPVSCLVLPAAIPLARPRLCEPFE